MQVPSWFPSRKGKDLAEGQPAEKHDSSSRFEGVRRECQAVHERVGVVDLSSRGVISVSGNDARKHLDSLFANSLPKVRLNFSCSIRSS